MVAVSAFDSPYAVVVVLIGKCGIELAVIGHKIDAANHVGVSRECSGDIGEVATVFIVDSPVADVMEARWISFDFTSPVSNATKVVHKVAPRGAFLEHGKGKSHRSFYEGGAVEAVDAYCEYFFRGFECVRGVWRAYEAAGKESRKFFGVGVLAGSIIEQGCYGGGVGRFVAETHLAAGRCCDSRRCRH